MTDHAAEAKRLLARIEHESGPLKDGHGWERQQQNIADLSAQANAHAILAQLEATPKTCSICNGVGAFGRSEPKVTCSNCNGSGTGGRI